MCSVKKKILLSAMLLCFSGLVGRAQNIQLPVASITDSAKSKVVKPAAVIKPKIKKPKPISRELSAGLRLNSDGWTGFVERGIVKSDIKESDLFYNIAYASIEFSEKKHPKERKSSSLGGSNDDGSNSYIFGKVNNFYTLKLGYGYRRMIAGKPDPGTVSIHWIYNGGLSLGLLKPYYVDMATSGESIKYTDSTQNEFLSGHNILGSSGLGKGLSELKFIPGLHFKTGLHFDFATTVRSKLAIETGISVELYTKKIELMANQNAVPYFANLYVSLQFGRRW